jgi:hypothetical protein
MARKWTCRCPSRLCELPKATQKDWAYFAGLIDGEGTVNIDAVKKKSGRYITFRPSLTIVSTTPCLTDWCWERFPIGSRCVSMKRPVNHRPMHRVLWTYHAALHIMRGLRPHLVLKGKQVDLAVGMPMSPNGQWGYTDEIRAAQRMAWINLRAARGPTSGITPENPPEIEIQNALP